MDSVNESILKKIKGLLAIANDNKDDYESQSAFLLAQKLMIKHNISTAAVEENNEKIDIQEGQVTAYKKLFWWEKHLAGIISENFRVKYFINLKKMHGSTHRKSAINFFGFEQDVELAKEMYILVYDALRVFTDRFISMYYVNLGIKSRKHSTTAKVKSSYMNGFLGGLDSKFKEQVSQMKQEYGLMVLVPAEVEQRFSEYTKDFISDKWTIPPIEELTAYSEGYDDAHKIDFTRTTIGEETVLQT